MLRSSDSRTDQGISGYRSTRAGGKPPGPGARLLPTLGRCLTGLLQIAEMKIASLDEYRHSLFSAWLLNTLSR